MLNIAYTTFNGMKQKKKNTERLGLYNPRYKVYSMLFIQILVKILGVFYSRQKTRIKNV